MEHTDKQLRYETRYAKKNSDFSRCFDIDDIPTRGPPSRREIPENITLDHATETAKLLMDESKLFICRKTGMMRPRAEHARKKAPTSTVTRPNQTNRRPEHEQHHRREHGNYCSRRDTWVNRQEHEHDRYEHVLANKQWDTDVTISSDSESDPNNAPRDSRYRSP